MTDKFPGFQSPEENWSKLPHRLIEALPNFTSQAELMVVLYILRHTWGFQEFETPKKITLDEFMHGRMTKKRQRMDGGVGMSKGAIVRGLQRAEEHGFIETEKDERDKARVKKYYMLKMVEEGIPHVVSQNETPKSSDVPKQDLDVPKQDTGVTKQDSYGPEVVHRSEKETLERNKEKETEEKESELSSKKPDPLLFSLDRQTLENNEVNYATPSQAGGDDIAASCAYTHFCQMQNEMPTKKERQKMILALSETLKPLAASADEIEAAFEIMATDFQYRVGNYNVFQVSFKQDLRTCIARARGQSASKDDRRARDVEVMQESLTILDERRAAQPPPAEDDAVGQIVKDELELLVPRHTFLMYIVPSIFTCADGALVITARDDFTRDWLENRLGEIIERTLAGVADGPEQVVFEVGE